MYLSVNICAFYCHRRCFADVAFSFPDSQGRKSANLTEQISTVQTECRRSQRLSNKMDNKSPPASQKLTDSVNQSVASTSTTSSPTNPTLTRCLLELNNNTYTNSSTSAVWKPICDKSRSHSSHTSRNGPEDSAFGELSETDEEIEEINSHVSSNQAQSCSSRSSSRQSCKRKRTNTLSADLEVEGLLESGTESVSSLDTRSLSDFSGRHIYNSG